MNLLKHLYMSVLGLPKKETELPDDLTAETMVMVVEAFWKASNNVIKTVVQDVLSRVRCPPECAATRVWFPEVAFLFLSTFVQPGLARTNTLLPSSSFTSPLNVRPCTSYGSIQGGNLSDPKTGMEMTMSIQEKSGPATDEAIKRFNLDSTVRPTLFKSTTHGWASSLMRFALLC